MCAMADLLSADEIERMARERGMTIPDLCRAAGIAHTTFYRWRTGTHELTLGVYRRLHDVATTGMVAHEDGGVHRPSEAA